MRLIKIKNLQEETDTFCDQAIASGEYYTIQNEAERQKFSYNSKVNTHLWSDPPKILVSDGIVDFSSIDGDKWLKGTNSVEYKPKVSQDDTVQMRPVGMQFTATQGTTTEYFWKFPEELCLMGGFLYVENNVILDKLNLAVVDHDNVLGYGVDFILNDYLNSWNIPPSGTDSIMDQSISDPIPSAFYIRIQYDAQAGTDRKVCLNLVCYKMTS